MPTVSIIIPHHNMPGLLMRCLKTIPDDPFYQVIIVDDNSDSDIANIDALYHIERDFTTVLFTKEGLGAGYARNIGLDKALGNWLLFADSDDYFTEDMDRIIRSYINSKSDMIIFKARSVNSETLELSDRNSNINMCIDKALSNEITTKDASLSVQSPWCRLIKKSLVKRNDIRFDEVMACNDAMFTSKCTCLSNMVSVSAEYLYVITFRNGSLWASRKTNPSNLLTRLEVQINRNKYVSLFGYKKLPIQGYLAKSYKFGFRTFCKALFIAIKKGALFQGISCYFIR